MSIQTRLSVSFSIAGTLLVAAGIAAILLIQHLNGILGEIGHYDFQSKQVADAMEALRLDPRGTQQNLARVNDLDKFARTAEEYALVREARLQLTQAGSVPAALDALHKLDSLYRDVTAEAHARLDAIHQRAVTGVIITIAVAVAVLVALMFLVRRWLLNPVLYIHAAASQLADGKRTQPVLVTGGPEIAELTAVLNKLATTHNELTDRGAKAERFAAVGEACSQVVHNLHGPLASIRAVARSGRDGGTIATEARAAFDHIIAAVDRLDRWVRDLVSTVHTPEPKRARQAIEPIVHDVVTLLRPSMAEKAIEVQFESSDSLPDVAVDRTMVEQALAAVLCNAIEASPDQGRILIGMAYNSNGLVTVSVQDEGSGMTEEIKRRATAAFFTTKLNGAGLGLTIAHRLVNLHGGKVDLESEPNKGTCVHIRLPVANNNHAPVANHSVKKA